MHAYELMQCVSVYMHNAVCMCTSCCDVSAFNNAICMCVSQCHVYVYEVTPYQQFIKTVISK